MQADGYKAKPCLGLVLVHALAWALRHTSPRPREASCSPVASILKRNTTASLLPPNASWRGATRAFGMNDSEPLPLGYNIPRSVRCPRCIHCTEWHARAWYPADCGCTCTCSCSSARTVLRRRPLRRAVDRCFVPPWSQGRRRPGVLCLQPAAAPRTGCCAAATALPTTAAPMPPPGWG